MARDHRGESRDVDDASDEEEKVPAPCHRATLFSPRLPLA
jgi:hypothetical protein